MYEENSNFERIIFWIPKTVKEELKAQCVKQRTTMTHRINDCIQKYLYEERHFGSREETVIEEPKKREKSWGGVHFQY